MDNEIRKCKMCGKELSVLDKNDFDLCQACRSRIGNIGGKTIKALGVGLIGLLIKVLGNGNKK